MEATFSFIDLAGFCALTEAHGDDLAADLALRFTTIVEESLAGEGRLVKRIGDAVLVTAADPSRMLRFLERLVARSVAETDFPALRTGIHHGEAVKRSGDVFGAAVNLAARITAAASGDEILATARVAAAAQAQGIVVTPLGPVSLRNVWEPVELFSLAIGAKPVGETIDPVCRMRVDRQRAAGRLRVGTTDYWFCSLGCAAAFARRPAMYTSPPS